MIDDIKKSLGSILYERTTSPFYGTLISSWILWNWKIVYLTIFVSENRINENKIDYITSNLTDIHKLLTYPILSTAVLLTVVPFVSNGAYWLSLKFSKWRKDHKNKIEMQQLLTLEQSIELREQISAQETRFEKLLENKNLEIKQLQIMLESNKADNDKTSIAKSDEKEAALEEELNNLAKRVKENTTESADYNKLIYYVQRGYKMNGDGAPTTKFIALMESYNIIQNAGAGLYTLTEVGKRFLRLMAK